MSTLVTCVFIVHNVPSRTEIMSMTQTCLETFETTADNQFEVILFDNGTKDDGTLFEYLKNWASRLGKLGNCERSIAIRHDRNESIAKCWNEAIDWAKGEVIVLLNNDVVFNRGGWLAALIDPLRHPSVGATGSKMMEWNNFIFLEGSFLAFKKDIALQIAENGKVFDERFIFTCEECDFQARLQRAGFGLKQTAIETSGTVEHFHHQTLCWMNEDGGWEGKSILDVMHDSRRYLCQKYGRAERVDD